MTDDLPERCEPDSSSRAGMPECADLVAELRSMIAETRSAVASSVNSGLTLLYWRVGKRINEEVLGNQRAEYGERIVATVSRELVREHGTGFGEKNLRRMMQFARTFPDEEIVVTLSRQLSWSHFLALIPLEKPLEREYYAEMCRMEGWSVRTLRKKIDSMLYERTALSRKPEELISEELQRLRQGDEVGPDMVLKDPYILDFLGLRDRYLEKDLEDAILRDMEDFLLELGAGFAFIGRQKRIQIDSDDFYIDLLFYNRRLTRLVCIDLKLGNFKAEYKGQMELYLRWLDKHERQPDEQPPIGIILCAGRKEEQIELLELGGSGIHVAEYLTELPPREVLARKLHSAIERARGLVGNRSEAGTDSWEL